SRRQAERHLPTFPCGGKQGIFRAKRRKFPPHRGQSPLWKKSRHGIPWRDFLAETVGFEPTCLSLDKTISSRSRYDHFDTSPLDKAAGAAEKPAHQCNQYYTKG